MGRALGNNFQTEAKKKKNAERWGSACFIGRPRKLAIMTQIKCEEMKLRTGWMFWSQVGFWLYSQGNGKLLEGLGWG